MNAEEGYARAVRDISAWLRTQLPVPVCNDLADRVARGAHREGGLDPPLSADDRGAIKLRYELRGLHMHVSVFVGRTAGALALSGELVMRLSEWSFFEGALLLGAPRVPWGSLVVLVEGTGLHR